MPVELNKCIALVEDDVNIQTSTRIFLNSQGYDVEVFRSAEHFAKDRKALDQYDLLLLDLNLPGASGAVLCEEIKKLMNAPPVVIITAQNDERTAVRCFELGADDFVRKPFGLVELKSRITRVIQLARRVQKQTRRAGFELDPKTHKLVGEGKEILLTRSEFLILEALLSRPGVKTTRDELAQLISLTIEVSGRTLDVHISRIRAKFKEAGLKQLSIQSVYGEGYLLEITNEPT